MLLRIARMHLDPSSIALLAAVLVVLVAVLAAWVGRLVERSRLREPLRDARVQTQVLTQLLDVWHWQTDREHRLTRLQPPQGAPRTVASSWCPTSSAARSGREV